jgi:hypothetical protein
VPVALEWVAGGFGSANIDRVKWGEVNLLNRSETKVELGSFSAIYTPFNS